MPLSSMVITWVGGISIYSGFRKWHPPHQAREPQRQAHGRSSPMSANRMRVPVVTRQSVVVLLGSELLLHNCQSVCDNVPISRRGWQV